MTLDLCGRQDDREGAEMSADFDDAVPSRTDIKADLDAIDAVLDAEDRRKPERFDGTEPINEFIARQRAKRERKE